MNKIFKTVFLCFACVLMLSACGSSDAVPKGSVASGIDIGQMTRSEAETALSEAELGMEESVTVKTDIYTLVFTAGEVGARYNAEETVDNIIAHKRGLFAKIKSNFVKTEYDMAVDIDEQLLDNAVANKMYGVERPVTQLSYELTDGGISVTNGLSGISLSREKVSEALQSQFGKPAEERKAVEIEIDKVVPDEVDIDAFLSEFQSEAREACYVRYPDGSIEVAEGQTGISMDTESAKSIMLSHTLEGENYLIPATVTVPTYTKAQLEACLFADTLATYSTNFSSSASNRADNITLAASKINNVILMPGETFSFNDALGERTIANGYKVAHAYAAGKVVDQVGGGICQVSSTLYNTVLLSNLMIVERRSHQMTVSYVPLGRDATVDWGTQDFKFNNNTYYPVKITAYTSGKNLYISITGTKPDKSLKVDIETEILSTIEPPVKTEEDPTMYVGETKVTQNGSKGYVVDAYRVVYSDGQEISREKLKRSTYNATSTITKVGTMQKATDPPATEGEVY